MGPSKKSGERLVKDHGRNITSFAQPTPLGARSNSRDLLPDVQSNNQAYVATAQERSHHDQPVPDNNDLGAEAVGPRTSSREVSFSQYRVTDEENHLGLSMFGEIILRFDAMIRELKEEINSIKEDVRANRDRLTDAELGNNQTPRRAPGVRDGTGTLPSSVPFRGPSISHAPYSAAPMMVMPSSGISLFKAEISASHPLQRSQELEAWMKQIENVTQPSTGEAMCQMARMMCRGTPEPHCYKGNGIILMQSVTRIFSPAECFYKVSLNGCVKLWRRETMHLQTNSCIVLSSCEIPESAFHTYNHAHNRRDTATASLTAVHEFGRKDAVFAVVNVDTASLCPDDRSDRPFQQRQGNSRGSSSAGVTRISIALQTEDGMQPAVTPVENVALLDEQAVRQAQRDDPTWRLLIALLTDGALPPPGAPLPLDDFEIKDELLYRLRRLPDRLVHQLVVPTTLQGLVIKQVHDEAHPGVYRTYCNFSTLAKFVNDARALHYDGASFRMHQTSITPSRIIIS
ncbi:hypothetical protein C7M84_010633 [Penaeus vannamei]|uniref:Uncharacterized protein n=1 Tax=Penaeus vannamei TaxID=6689 RepID=A0A423T493_PENVA|nr:hypothetical protein C7M84_010633 [Penaeus vannamei]